MKRSLRAGVLVGCCLLAPGDGSRVQAGAVPREYRATITTGLDWLAGAQAKDGHWGATGDQYPVAITALAGMAFLMEGSTIGEGKYADPIRRAADWLLDPERTRPNGLIGNVDNPQEANRYMYGHGFATLFLACVHGDEDDQERRQKLRGVLKRAVKFIGAAQSSQGGWYYTSAKDGHDDDEGSVTITQLQALRACRNAGIPVPKVIIDKARKYLGRCTQSDGSVVYSLSVRQRYGPALTAAALACGFSAGEYQSDLVKQWVRYCRGALGTDASRRFYHYEYTHYYWAQAVYILGEDRYARLFPRAPVLERITWSKYRKAMFDQLKRTQNKDGSWSDSGIGQAYATAIDLTILQLDNATLPIYQR